jgi:hypothetical protein
MMKIVVPLFALAATPALAAAPQHFSVTASYVPPAKAGAPGAIAVTFVGRDPDIHINEEPPPRLRLDPEQKVLLDKQPPPPSRVTPYDPATAKYLDLAAPVTFPVALAPGASKGLHDVDASVTYFYCSKREGWCRKGTSDVSVAVTVP